VDEPLIDYQVLLGAVHAICAKLNQIKWLLQGLLRTNSKEVPASGDS